MLNQEFLLELEKTGNLAKLDNRITKNKNKLKQSAIKIKNTNITNTVVNTANVGTVENIQKEINTITNTNIKNIDGLPNQITRIRERLNKNRDILTQIEDIQTDISNITKPTMNTQDIQKSINIIQKQLNACSSIRGILENIS